MARDVADYLAAVEHHLADLPADDRAALMEDLALHLDALAAEDDGRPIAVRLGSAADYAAELRTAAGLPPATGRSGPRLRDVLAQVSGTPVGREALRLARELRPAWWLLRGYLLVAVPTWLETQQPRRVFPVPTPLGSDELGLLLVVAAMIGSVLLGRRTLPHPARLAVGVAGAVLAVLGFLLLTDAWRVWTVRAVEAGVVYAPPEQAMGEYPLLSRYGPVTDVFPYAADGTPLEDVLLYDQDGRPLQVGRQEWWADRCARVVEQPRAEDGVPVPFSYPQRYELDPAGVDLYGSVAAVGQCDADLDRPEVPLPVFPPEPEAQPTAEPSPAD